MRLQSAIFDLDGTLLDSMGAWDAVSADVVRALGAEPEADLADKVRDLTPQGRALYCKNTYGLTQSTDELLAMVAERMAEFYRSEVRVKPGVQKFLSLLKMEGVWMYVATNTDRRLVELALKKTGLEGYFRGIITCAEAGAGKRESAVVYEKAMRRLRSNKKDTVIFEDALHAVRTAKAAGFRVCGVCDPSAEGDREAIRAEADYYIRTFEEMFETTMEG